MKEIRKQKYVYTIHYYNDVRKESKQMKKDWKQSHQNDNNANVRKVEY